MYSSSLEACVISWRFCCSSSEVARLGPFGHLCSPAKRVLGPLSPLNYRSTSFMAHLILGISNRAARVSIILVVMMSFREVA